jgi:perosamine synthetase
MDSGWISSTGSFIQRFEEAFAAYVGTKHALGVINGTAACHLVMLSIGAGPGQEVVIPATTFVATANAVTYCGASVRVIDIDKNSWNMDTKLLRVSEKTTAVFFVHLYGNMCNMDELNSITKEFVLVEDACEALGGEWKNQRAGSLAKAAAFSFYANKTISTGEGGMFVCDDDDIYERAKLFRGQGQTTRYYHPVIGYNYRMTNIQAAIGLAQLERINEIMNEKRRVYERYKSRLQGPVFSAELPESKHSCWAVTVALNGPSSVAKVLEDKGIESRRVFYPICDLPPYLGTGDCPNARWLREHGLTLPSYSELKDSQIDDICDIVNAETERTK